MDFNIGDKIKIYFDYQNELDLEGEAIIIEIKGSDLPFILDGSDVNFKVYNTLKCIVKWSKSKYHHKDDLSFRRIRYLERIGYAKYEDEEE